VSSRDRLDSTSFEMRTDVHNDRGRAHDALLISFGILVVLLGSTCRQPTPAVTGRNAAGDAYAPGLGEIMTLQQMRHIKLWLAGDAGNWDLAGYEIKELGEGFDDIVRFHPTHEGSAVAPKDAIPRMITVPMSELRAALDRKDPKDFQQAYDGLTKACNDCHQATNFSFNRVQRPTMNPYSNQVFAPPRQ
jgi:hypothetical protein